MARRQLLQCGALVAAMALTSPGLYAQTSTDYPNRPVRLIVPYAPGGGPDVLTRKMAEVLARTLKTPVVVENKVGAGGMLAGEYLARAPADGYTLMLGASTHLVQKLMQPELRFDPLTDFVHVTRGAFAPQVLVVDAESPYTSAEALIEAARNAPEPINYASGGIGSAAHLAAAAFVGTAGIPNVHIPYRGSVEIVPALLRGDVLFGFPTASTALPQITNGRVRALAVSGDTRLPQLPDVPTLNEIFGRDDLALDSWSGIWAPAGTPPAIVNRLDQALRAAYADPDVHAFHEQVANTIAPTSSPADFSAFVAAETAKYRHIIDAHLTPAP